MKLSFVIPAYNEELYIGKCLESILRELKGKSYNTEIIVVNNASTDRTGEVARSFPGVTVVDEPIKGIVHARHAGLVAATGELIANVDADAMLTTGWVDRVMKEFSCNDNLVALSGPAVFYDAPASVRHGVKLFYYIGYAGYIFNRFILRIGSMLQGGNFVVRRDALEKAGGYDLNINFYGEDADIARRLHPLGDVKFTLALPMYMSGRRLMNEGPLTMAWRYALNYFWTIYTKKPYSLNYIDIRVAQDGEKPLAFRPQNKKREWAIFATAIALVLVIAGGAGLLVASQVDAQVTPKQFALRMYHKLYDNDNDLAEWKARWATMRQQLEQSTAMPQQ